MKSNSCLAVIGACLLASTPVVAQENEQVAAVDVDDAKIDQAKMLGYKIYRYDQAAWHTTDEMLKSIQDPGAAGIRGWIINEVEDGLEAVFMRKTEDGFEAVWSGVYDGKKVRKKKSYDPGERPFTDSENAQAVASNAPLSEERTRCSSKPFNTVVFPTGKSDGGFYVYFLVPQDEMAVVPFGGHYRYEVLNGEVVASRNFTNSCISLGNRGSEGRKLVGAGISHSLDKVPTEIHVFSMYALGIPVMVITSESDVIWKVESNGGEPTIEILER